MALMSVLWYIFFAFAFVSQVNSTSFPSRLPATVYSSPDSSGSTCPSQDTISEEHRRARESILDYYNRPCSCGGPGWTRLAYLDMSDTNQQCPSNWRLTTSPVRGCGRSSNGYHTCDSMIYPVSGRTYSSVCGRINAYQREGSSNGFFNYHFGFHSRPALYIRSISDTWTSW